MNSEQFFLGANTPNGFFSLFNELYNPYGEWQMYIIKGGPGTGKSTIMKDIAKTAEEKGFLAQRIPCSSDPYSLDAVIIPELKTAIADGTSPHTIEPVFPGVCENTIDLSICWNKNKLKENASKIKMIATTNSAAHKKCVKFMKAASLLEDEIKKYTYTSVDFDKIERFSKRICDTYFKQKLDKDEAANISLRFLTALTPIGIHFITDYLENDCETVITVRDNIEIAELIINKIKNTASDKKYDMIVCNCPLGAKTKTEHIIFPELSLAFTTSNEYHSFKGNKVILTSRFTDRGVILKYRNTVNFLKRAKREMINEALEALKSAKSAHDILESYYIDAMDFKKVNAIKDSIINEIFSYDVSRESSRRLTIN